MPAISPRFFTIGVDPPPLPRVALEGNGPPRRPQKPLDRQLEGVAKAVGGGYCRLQMPLRWALGVRGTVAGHRLGALEGGGGLPPPIPMHPDPPDRNPPPHGQGIPRCTAWPLPNRC